MGFAQWSDEEEKQLNGIIGDTPDIEEDESAPEEPVEEPESKPEPEVKPEPKPEQKPEPAETAPVDNNGWSRLRFEKSEAERKNAELAAELERLKNPPKPIPTEEEDIAGHLKGVLAQTNEQLAEIKQWKEAENARKNQEHIFNGAINEFRQQETAYSATVDDYEPVSKFLNDKISSSIRMLNPGISEIDVQKSTFSEILRRASVAAQNNLNPAEALYKQGLSAGYKPVTDAEPEERSNLAAIAVNKKKTTNMIGTSSGGKADPTLKSIANGAQAEIGKLSESELDRLIYGSM